MAAGRRCRRPCSTSCRTRPARGAPKVAERLASARRAFERERYQEARSVLVPARPGGARLAGGARAATVSRCTASSVGASAATELEAYRALTGSADQLPVLADCYRALRRYDRVDELWAELREVSPSAAVVAEGRIVAAGALADQGDLQGALALLERVAAASPKRGPGAPPPPVVRAGRPLRPGRRRAPCPGAVPADPRRSTPRSPTSRSAIADLR